jgi:hydroxypyruvate isomerase
MLFSELPVLDRPAAAVECGFQTIECWWPPDGLERAWAERVRALPVAVASVNAPDSTIGGVRAAVELARAVGAPAINLPLDDSPDARLVRELSDVAREADLLLLIEALNPRDAPGYPLQDADAAARFIKAVGNGSVRMLFDAYHSAEGGREPGSEVHAHAELIAHVHYADSPGRGAPGTGHSDVWELIDALEAVGYDGAVSLEYRCSGQTAESLRFLELGSAHRAIAMRSTS